jgi:hypothetical protein
MRTATTTRPTWLQTVVVQLGASLRGVVYGFALVIAASVAWSAGQTVAAVFIGGVAILGIGLEVVATQREDHGR